MAPIKNVIEGKLNMDNVGKSHAQYLMMIIEEPRSNQQPQAWDNIYVGKPRGYHKGDVIPLRGIDISNQDRDSFLHWEPRHWRFPWLWEVEQFFNMIEIFEDQKVPIVSYKLRGTI